MEQWCSPVLDSPPQWLGCLCGGKEEVARTEHHLRGLQWCSVINSCRSSSAPSRWSRWSPSPKKEKSMLTPQQTQISKVTSYLHEYESSFPENVQKIQLGGQDRDYMNAIEVYAKAAHHLTVPHSSGHKAVLASPPNELSLVAKIDHHRDSDHGHSCRPIVLWLSSESSFSQQVTTTQASSSSSTGAHRLSACSEKKRRRQQGPAFQIWFNYWINTPPRQLWLQPLHSGVFERKCEGQCEVLDVWRYLSIVVTPTTSLVRSWTCLNCLCIISSNATPWLNGVSCQKLKRVRVLLAPLSAAATTYHLIHHTSSVWEVVFSVWEEKWVNIYWGRVWWQMIKLCNWVHLVIWLEEAGGGLKTLRLINPTVSQK